MWLQQATTADNISSQHRNEPVPSSSSTLNVNNVSNDSPHQSATAIKSSNKSKKRSIDQIAMDLMMDVEKENQEFSVENVDKVKVKICNEYDERKNCLLEAIEKVTASREEVRIKKKYLKV